MDPEIYLLKLRIAKLESENEKLKQLVKPKVHPPPIQGDASVKELVDQSDIQFRCGLLVQGSDGRVLFEDKEEIKDHPDQSGVGIIGLKR